METSCVKKHHLTESSVLLALSSHNSQCSKWNGGAPRCRLGCGTARGSLNVPEQIVQEPQSLLKREFMHTMQHVLLFLTSNIDLLFFMCLLYTAFLWGWLICFLGLFFDCWGLHLIFKLFGAETMPVVRLAM